MASPDLSGAWKGLMGRNSLLMLLLMILIFIVVPLFLSIIVGWL